MSFNAKRFISMVTSSSPAATVQPWPPVQTQTVADKQGRRRRYSEAFDEAAPVPDDDGQSRGSALSTAKRSRPGHDVEALKIEQLITEAQKSGLTVDQIRELRVMSGESQVACHIRIMAHLYHIQNEVEDMKRGHDESWEVSRELSANIKGLVNHMLLSTDAESYKQNADVYIRDRMRQANLWPQGADTSRAVLKKVSKEISHHLSQQRAAMKKMLKRSLRSKWPISEAVENMSKFFHLQRRNDDALCARIALLRGVLADVSDNTSGGHTPEFWDAVDKLISEINSTQGDFAGLLDAVLQKDRETYPKTRSLMKTLGPMRDVAVGADQSQAASENSDSDGDAGGSDLNASPAAAGEAGGFDHTESANPQFLGYMK